MSEEHSIENEDYDREDLEHVENLLYANIHYDTGCDGNQFSSTNPSNDNNVSGNNSGTNTPTDVDRRNSGPQRRNAKRYWTTHSNASSPSNFVPFYKEKQSGIYKTAKVVITDQNKSVPENAKNDESREETTAVTAPKQFTPYVSFLPFNDSASNVMEEEAPIATTSKDNSNRKVLKTNNDLVRKNLTIKHINPFSKKHLIDQYKQLVKEDEAIEAIEEELGKKVENTKRLNPFNALSRKAKKRKSEVNQSKNVKKISEESKQEPAPIDLDEEDKDDDDVIILPTQPPPLINIVDSSDEEPTPTNAQEHEFTEPTAVSDNRRKAPRCTSPSSSIQSADDFIGQNDQRNFGFETFGTLSDEEICQVNETVENQLQNKKTKDDSNKRAAIPSGNDNAVFTPPKQMNRDKTKATTKKSYEVGANSFTAVDVYESESSDMPDSVYAKGVTSKRKKMSDSDSSSVEDVSIAKSKRLRKRKSSGSARESDQMHSDDSSSDLPEEDDDDTDNDDEPNENSYLVRGEALGKVKNSNKKKSAKANKGSSEKRSKDDFINKLSSIVHGQNESENDEPESPHETSAESVGARDIVETVLQRRTKKSKKNQNTETEPVPSDSEKSNPWEITDQIGETDDLNLGRIIDESALESLNDDGKSQSEAGNSENTAPNQEQPPEQNEKESEPNTEEPSKSVEQPQQSSVDQSETVPIEEDERVDVDMFSKEVGWNDEMRKFYGDSWGGETFSLRNIRARMPKGFLNWMITNKDKFPSPSNNRGRQFRCLNCQDKGHLARNCPLPPAKKRCYMCGVEGHLEPKCPNKICLLCGRKSQRYSHGCGECNRDRDLVCHICRQKGHKQFLCPDRWRRYHSTITPNEELVRETISPNSPPKVKYCCLCANRGHYPEKCNRANRTPGPLSVNISSYRCLLKTPFNMENKAPKCTILTSNLEDYNFNFGNEMSNTGNTIYGRFRRAVKLNLNQSTTSENDVIFVKESNLHDTSDPPIEVYDDFDFEMDDFDDVSSSDQSTGNPLDDSFVTIDSLDAEEEEGNAAKDTTEPNADENIVEVLPADKEAAIKRLDDRIHTLEELKGKMLSQKSNEDINESHQSIDYDMNVTIDSDMNVSGQKNDVTTSSALPDFIPLTSEEPEKYEATRSPSPVSADSTTTANEKTDATIHLTKQHCKQLLSEKGDQFLRNSELQYNVSVRLEWKQYGNVLIVNGIASNQQNFHNVLKEFFESAENQQKTNPNVQLPKNRDALIRFVRSHVAILDSPMCNSKNVADVQGLFHRIRQNERNPSKANVKQILRLRKHLNMVLFGRYGLADGKSHMDALQTQLRRIMNGNNQNVPVDVRQKMGEHFSYIFSGNDHKNYEDTIEHYNQLKRNQSLPPLMLDRKLMGLKINVYPNDNNFNNTPKQKNSFKNSSLPLPSPQNRTSTITRPNDQGNKLNAPPSLLDIQINVSPSTSSSHQNQLMQRRHSFSSNRNRSLDKWKY